jgi:hypothetical protein
MVTTSTFARRALYLDRAILPAHDAGDGGASQAAAEEFRRVEGIEHFGLCLGVHTPAGVPDFDADRVFPRFRADLYLASFRFDGFGRIGQQVDYDLLNLCRVRFNQRQINRQAHLQADSGRDGRKYQIANLADGFGNGKFPHLVPAVTRVSESGGSDPRRDGWLQESFRAPPYQGFRAAIYPAKGWRSP